MEKEKEELSSNLRGSDSSKDLNNDSSDGNDSLGKSASAPDETSMEEGIPHSDDSEEVTNYEGGGDGINTEEDEEELNNLIGDALLDVEQTEEAEIDANESFLENSLHKAEDYIKITLGKLFGEDEDDDITNSVNHTSINDEEMEEIVQEVTNQLESKIHEKFKDEADRIVDEKEEEILKVVGEDEVDGMKDNNIEKDVAEVEKKVIEDLKDEIDDAAEKIESHINEEAAEIEAEVIEEHTGKNAVVVSSGKGTIQLEIEEQDVDYAETGETNDGYSTLKKGDEGGKEENHVTDNDEEADSEEDDGR
eukprot:3827832-Ditylum_brightwellii.AAC.1